MDKISLRLVTAITFLAVLLCVTAWSLSTKPSGATFQRSETQQPRKLRELAQEREIEVSSHSESETEYESLNVLSKDAEAVVLGRITEKEASFSQSGESIYTTYLIEVERVIKNVKLNAPLGPGKRQPASLTTPLKLVRPGGEITVNGHRATVKVAGQNLLAIGNTYVFFLWWGPEYNAYYLAGGLSGAVRINDNRQVEPLATSKTLNGKYKGADVESFVDEVLRAQP